MDAIINYLSRHLKNAFVSHPPSSTSILLWPNASLNQQQAIVTRQKGQIKHPHEDRIIKILDAPLIIYHYDHKSDLLEFRMKEQTFSGGWQDPNLRRVVAGALGIPYQPGGTMKAPNNSQQVIDLFHVWSREAFAGIQKTDIDLLLLDNQRICTLIEVKRSAKIPVGQWSPYRNDPYDGLAHFAQTWGIPFFAVHHEIIDNSKFSTDIPVDVFEYNPASPFDFARFSRESNRRVMTLQDFLKKMKSLCER